MRQIFGKIAFALLGGIAYCAGCSMWNKVIEPGITKVKEHLEKKILKEQES